MYSTSSYHLLFLVVMFPPFGQPSYLPIPQVSQLPSIPAESSNQFFQPAETPMHESSDPQYGNQTGDTQYGNQTSPSYTSQQSSFMTKPVAIPHHEQRRGHQEPMYGNQMSSFASMQIEGYGVSPSSFLSTTHKEQTLPSTAMEIGTPPTGVGFAPPTAVKMETGVLNAPTVQPHGRYIPTTTSPFHPPVVPPSSVPITRSASDPLFTGVSALPSASQVYTHPAAAHPQHRGVFVSTQTQTSPPPSAALPCTSPVTTPLPPTTPSSSNFPLSLQQQQQHSAEPTEFQYTSTPPPPPPPPQSYAGGGRQGEYWSPQHSFPKRKSSAELQQNQQSTFTSPPPPPQPPHGFPSQQMSGGEALPETNLQLLAEQMQQLEQQQFQQLKEIEKQQTRATQQYLGLLHRYISQSGSHTSQQQQQVLQSVLSDPSSVHILKTILLQEGAGDGGKKGESSQQALNQEAAKSNGEVGGGGREMVGEKQDGSLQPGRTGSQLLSPAQLAKVLSG